MRETSTCQLITTTRDLEAFFGTNGARSGLPTQNATPFQSPEWLLPWWHQFGQPGLRAVVIRESGRPIVLLPLYIYFDEARDERQLLLFGAGTRDYLSCPQR